jgi:hypothetical protein
MLEIIQWSGSLAILCQFLFHGATTAHVGMVCHRRLRSLGRLGLSSYPGRLGRRVPAKHGHWAVSPQLAQGRLITKCYSRAAVTSRDALLKIRATSPASTVSTKIF